MRDAIVQFEKLEAGRGEIAVAWWYIYRQNCAMQNDLVIVIVVERDGCRGVGRPS